MTWCGHAPGEYPNIHGKNRPECLGVHSSANFSVHVLNLVILNLDLLVLLNLATAVVLATTRVTVQSTC